MPSPAPEGTHHHLKGVAADFPDLAIEAGMGEGDLKQLEAKYGILIQIADQSLRDRELRVKEGTARIDRWSNPLLVGIMVGALGLVGSFINGVWGNRNEKTKLQNELIKVAIQPADSVERAKSLVFFANNGLIDLDRAALASLTRTAGSDNPVPGSSGSPSMPGRAQPVEFTQSIVDRIAGSPTVPYPPGVRPEMHLGDTLRKAIILHDAIAGDGSLTVLRAGMGPQLPGPLAHWVVQSDGTIAFVADETRRANHVGRAERGLSNANTIGISVTGLTALSDDQQTENLIRLVADVADRWGIPTSMILSHGEVSPRRGPEMVQQAPAIRQMVDAVRKRH